MTESTNKAAYYFQRLRELIAFHIEQEAHEVFGGEVEVDESYFGGTRTRDHIYTSNDYLFFTVIENNY
jgi:hypothetical protein